MQMSKSSSIQTNPQILKLKRDTEIKIYEKKQELVTVEADLTTLKFSVNDTNKMYDSLALQ